MGMPISLALRGATPTPRGAAAWEDRAVVAAGGRRGLQHLARRLGGSRGWAGASWSVDDCPIEVGRGAAAGRGRPAVRPTAPSTSAARSTGDRARPVGGGEGLGGERAFRAAARPPRHRRLPLRRRRPGLLPRPGAQWRIGVEDPHDPTRTVAVIPVHDGAVATSGAAHRGAHIRHALTGLAPTHVASVTVVSESLHRRRRRDLRLPAGPGAAAWLRPRGRTGVVVRAPGCRGVGGLAGIPRADPYAAYGEGCRADPSGAVSAEVLAGLGAREACCTRKPKMQVNSLSCFGVTSMSRVSLERSAPGNWSELAISASSSSTCRRSCPARRK